MEFLFTDSESLLGQFRRQEKHLRHKRRWLMGLELAKSKERKFNKDRTIPESFLREDDVFYETIKRFVERGFGSGADRRENQLIEENIHLFDNASHKRNLFLLVDDLSNQGLYLLAKVLTGGLIKFEKVRWKLKKIIRERLSKLFKNQNDEHVTNMAKQVSLLLMDPGNFCDNCTTVPFSVSPRLYAAAAAEVLDALEDFPIQTLNAMHRKLRGIEGYMPQLRPQTGLSRGTLINQVRKSCKAMLSELDEGDELQEPLSTAVGVGGLSLKLLLGRSSSTEFQQVSPRTEALQNEIAKALWLLKKKVTFSVLRNLQLLLDPDREFSDRILRSAVSNLLTEFLLECSDMETIPGYLLETLATIYRSSSDRVPFRYFSKKDVEEEVECVLCVSAQIKQVVWDLLPKTEFDQDYINAYMEKLEESDDNDDYDDNDVQEESFLDNTRRFYANDQIEGTGEINPTCSTSSASTIKGNGSSSMHIANGNLKNDSLNRQECDNTTRMDSEDFPVTTSPISCQETKIFESPQNMNRNVCMIDLSSPKSRYTGNGPSPSFSPVETLSAGRKEPKADPEISPSNLSSREENIVHEKQSHSENHFLALQETCDETSMVAYRLVGCMLDEFAQIEGYSLEDEDISYLRNSDATSKEFRAAKEEEISYDEDTGGSIIIQVLEGLIPSFPSSGKERLKELMGLR